MVRFGVHVGPQMTTMSELRRVWAHAENLGFDWLSVWDHFYPAPHPLDGDCFEAVACHAALAASTTRVRVGCLVYSSGYRHPAVLANAGATIDHLSGGRLEMGIGAGWHEAEYDAYGIPFESPGTRLRRMRETVEVVRLLWSEDPVSYDGEFFHLTRAHCNPKPVQARPRIWVGAMAERALRMAGEIADGWNIPFASPEDFARKLAVVREHAPDPGRLAVGVNLGLVVAKPHEVDDAVARRFGNLAQFARPGILAGSPGEITDRVGRYVESGADWVVLALRAPFELDMLEAFAAEVVPQFAGHASSVGPDDMPSPA